MTSFYDKRHRGSTGGRLFERHTQLAAVVLCGLLACAEGIRVEENGARGGNATNGRGDAKVSAPPVSATLPSSEAGSIEGDAGACTTFESPGCAKACAAIVPDDYPNVESAIGAVQAPATICIRAGDYHENLTLRPQVSLQGVGPATAITGFLSVHDLASPNPAPLRITSLKLVARGTQSAILSACSASASECVDNLVDLGGATLALHFEHVSFVMPEAVGTYVTNILTRRGSTDVSFVDSSFRSPRGIRLVTQASSEQATQHRLFVSGSTFGPFTTSADDSMYQAIDYNVPSAISARCDAQRPMERVGTRVQARIENNVFLSTRYEAIYLASCLKLQAADDDASLYLVVNNTFLPAAVASSDQRSAVFQNVVDATMRPKLAFVNNLHFGGDVRGMSAAQNAHNLAATALDVRDLASGDLHLSPGSRAIDRADPAYAPKWDRDGVQRPMDGDGDGTQVPDIGAYEHDRSGT